MQAAARGYPLGSLVAALLRLLDQYGAAELTVAIGEALSRNVPHPNAVRLHLAKRREAHHQLPPVHLALPNDVRVRELVVHPHNLNDYDQLQRTTEESQHDD